MTERYDPDMMTPEEHLARSLAGGVLPAPSGDRVFADLVAGLQVFRAVYEQAGFEPDAAATARMRAYVREAIAASRDRRSFAARLADFLRIGALRPAWAVAAIAVVMLATTVLIVRPWSPAETLVARSGVEKTVYEADDGTVVTLRPHSRLVALRSTGNRSYRLEGEAFFVVARDERRPFTVTAGDGMVTVLGTRFTFGSWESSATVYVDEGSVRFSGRATGSSIDLTAGQGSELVDGNPAMAPRIDRTSAMDWLENALVLDSQTLESVLGELQQQFDIRISYPDTLAGERLSGRILLEDRDQALLDLGIVVGGVFVPTGPSSYRFDTD